MHACRFAATALAAALAMTLGACGEDKLDTSKLEDQIKASLERDADTKLRAVKCPDDVKAEKGDKFTCTATGANGRTVTVDVTQTNDTGDVRYEVR